ncbi:MAG: N-acetyltransferase, partial [Phenylobacterium sp.]|nr:N-acetyltransferase [Phenylobacterium sp.]
MIVRPAEAADMTALAEIYGHHVLHGFGTFEEVPPSADELNQRREAIVARGLPYLLAEDQGKVLGFAYAGPFRLRAA